MDAEDPLMSRWLSLIMLVITLIFLVSPVQASSGYDLPQTVVVRFTGHKDCRGLDTVHYESREVDFKEYVKGVLPNEWGYDWHQESVRAGAVAVKMYAWATYQRQGYLWDCNWNQVYFPAARKPQTDQAVEDTWDWILWDAGPVQVYYDDWPAACLSRGQTENCMSQWKTKSDAENGQSWQDIVMKYYEGELICPTCSDLTYLVKNEEFNQRGLTDRLYSLYQFESFRQ